MTNSKIMMITPTVQSVLANGIIELTTIARRTGQCIQSTSGSVTLNKPGYYKVSGMVTFTVPVAGDVQIVLAKNGVAIPGITSSTTITTATTQIATLPIEGIVRVFCNEQGATISLINTGVEISASNVELDIEYLD